MSKYKPYSPKIDLWANKTIVAPKPEVKRICGNYAEWGFNNGNGCPKDPGHKDKCGFWEEKQ